VLHELVSRHAQTLLAELRDADGRGLPRHVERELAEYLRCGILAHGFARVRCQACADEILVAFSWEHFRRPLRRMNMRERARDQAPSSTTRTPYAQHTAPGKSTLIERSYGGAHSGNYRGTSIFSTRGAQALSHNHHNQPSSPPRDVPDFPASINGTTAQVQVHAIGATDFAGLTRAAIEAAERVMANHPEVQSVDVTAYGHFANGRPATTVGGWSRKDMARDVWSSGVLGGTTPHYEASNGHLGTGMHASAVGGYTDGGFHNGSPSDAGDGGHHASYSGHLGAGMHASAVGGYTDGGFHNGSPSDAGHSGHHASYSGHLGAGMHASAVGGYTDGGFHNGSPGSSYGGHEHGHSSGASHSDGAGSKGYGGSGGSGHHGGVGNGGQHAGNYGGGSSGGGSSGGGHHGSAGNGGRHAGNYGGGSSGTSHDATHDHSSGGHAAE
jgi:hypothetical protein